MTEVMKFYLIASGTAIGLVVGSWFALFAATAVVAGLSQLLIGG